MKSENLHLGWWHTQSTTLAALHETLAGWYRRAHERSELTQLDAWNKRDLGLGDSDIFREANKHCWQV